uniref:Dolabellanin-B2 n=1 Tax=Dolabella auricularia TaxID=6511 RepID=DBB2_DOLAU|nr:RecName: Full=Dolabellanin-B2 [Dolabella auricularia]
SHQDCYEALHKCMASHSKPFSCSMKFHMCLQQQ